MSKPKTDTCPLCGGTRHLMTFSALCEDCDTVQRLPEQDRLRTAIANFKRAVLDSIPFVRHLRP